MSTEIKLPNLGENIESGDVLSLLVAEGDVVEKDQDLMELETDKATLPIPSPEAGKIVRILVSEGDTVPVGAAIAEIETSENGSAAAEEATEAPAPPPQEEKQPEPAEQPVAAEAPAEQEAPPPARTPAASSPAAAVAEPPPAPPVPGRPTPSPAQQGDVPGDGRSSAAAGPAVRRLARELGVDLRRVLPTGSGGRVTEQDVRDHVRTLNQQAAAAADVGVTPPGSPETDGFGAVRREKMSRMRQTIARNMTASYTTIPQLTNFDDVDTTELERIRKESKEDYAAQDIKLTAMPFVVKAVATALKHHPVVNASVSEEGDHVIYKEYVNVGVAVDTDRGLLVPVLRDADRKNIPTIAREIAELATAAREGTFSLDDLRGGTFTVSNLGAIGGVYSTPIINPPEAAILLIGRSRTLPVYKESSFEPRLMMPLSLTYDHRIVDGAAAARFLNAVKGYLANPGRLLLAP